MPPNITRIRPYIIWKHGVLAYLLVLQQLMECSPIFLGSLWLLLPLPIFPLMLSH